MVSQLLMFLVFCCTLFTESIDFVFKGPSVDPVNEETLTLDYRRELVMNLTVLRQWRSSDENEMLLNVLGGGNSYGDMGLRTRRNNDGNI